MVDRTETVDAMITLEVLPAGYGDCLLVSCQKPGATWRLLVDTGPDEETWSTLRARLQEEIPPDENGRRHIDLVILSHIDHDHIGATRFLFADQTLRLTFGDIWFNGRPHLDERGVAEAEALSKILSAPDQPLPWNTAFQGRAVVIPGHREFLEIETSPESPGITLLSPTPQRLVKLARVWDAEVAKLQRRESNTEEEPERGGSSLFPNLEGLAAHESRPDTSETNGSSIAILLEHRGASVLLGADAFAVDLRRALLGLAKARGLKVPLQIDAFKLSHHGSRANLLPKLFGAVEANHYVVSTDNTRFGHPHDEALARVVRFGGDAPTLCFNYETTQNLRWSNHRLQQKYGFATRFPENQSVGLRLELPLRETLLRKR